MSHGVLTYVDNLLGELGGERIMKLATGDEISGQEQEFHKWAPEVFKVACETFCLDSDETTSWNVGKQTLTDSTVHFTEVKNATPLDAALGKYHHRKIIIGNMKKPATNLQCGAKENSERLTILVEIVANGINYEPGDHVGILPENRQDIVNGIIERLAGVENPDVPLQLEILTENHTSNGIVQSWEPHDKIPACSLRTMLTRFVDITTPPSRQILTLLATYCKDAEDKKKLTNLANDSATYEEWRYYRIPHLLEVLQEFPSCQPTAAVLIGQLMPLQPRFYSISSSLKKYNNEVHLTVAIVKYRTQDEDGPEHFGVCSNYLNGLKEKDNVYFFVRSASSFHIPKDITKPIILIGPGTGIAPFRSFWQEWEVKQIEGVAPPKVWLLFGCRNSSVDLYRDEKEEMVKKKVIDRVFLALSREKNVPKTYVQDIALKEADSIYQLLVVEQGHVYVCGDVTMAEHVYQTLRTMLTRFVDITTPPSRQILTLLATYCKDAEDKKKLTNLANDSATYEEWRYYRIPHLLEVLQEFPSCQPTAAVLIGQLMPLQPRFYPISSSLKKYNNEVHLTVAIVKYRTQDEDGPEHFGVCSNYLNGLKEKDNVYFFVRSASSFHIPKDITKPIILIGPGTGIAPFRSFWQEWEVKQIEGVAPPKVWLLFGCRNSSVDLYRDEKEEMVKKKVIDRVFLALSREKNVPKTYVQDIALKEADSIYQLLVVEQGHVYVCGDVTMAEHVYQTLRTIIARKEVKSDSEAEKFMLQLRDENRYHEDIFGITLRTAEVHNKSRESARIRMASQP
uniref:nitric-oxide synthase (NADPH) n=1 Tax=Lutzomyia longipalpis TaxID=7200 RepID=A0A1B0CIF3_LUTLO